MSYKLQAIVAAQGTFPTRLPVDAAVCRLGGGVEIVPLGASMRRRYNIPLLPLTDEGSDVLPAALCRLCAELAVHGPVAYVEAESFGGQGAQAHVLVPCAGPAGVVVVADDAVNAALRWLGVTAADGRDEFATVGLDRNRDTEAWLDDDASTEA